MKTTRKRIAVLLIAAAMSLPMAACSHGGDNTETTTTAVTGTTGTTRDRSSEQAALVSQITIGPNGGIDAGLVFVDDPGEADASNPYIGTTPPVVTTMIGTDGNAYVAKTDVNGTTVTQENGEAATELFTGTVLPVSYAEPDYVPEPKGYLSMWIETNRGEDYKFNGEFLVFDIKVKEDTKDGVYPINFYHLDFANYNGDTLPATATMGYICVGSEKPEVENTSGGLSIIPDVVQAKPGETIKYAIKIENNPGIVGFVTRFTYDSKAFEIVKGSNGKDFQIDTKVKNVDFTTDAANADATTSTTAAE